MFEDAMPTTCEYCDSIVDFRNMVRDPRNEYDMVCTTCADQRTETFKPEEDEES